MVTIRDLESYSIRAWPALENRYYDGWLLRLAGTYTRRANSVNPLFGSSLDLAEKINFCESFYFSRNHDIHFKMTADVYPTDLDDILNRRGYIKTSPTCIMLRDLESLQFEDLPVFEVEPKVSPEWIHDFVELNQVAKQHATTIRRMLNKIIVNAAFSRIVTEDKTVAVGLAVQEDEYVGLFDIVTSPEYRRMGYGAQLVNGLLRWGQELGAKHAYLQVVAENMPAIALYKKLGFREFYQYWYRTKECPDKTL